MTTYTLYVDESGETGLSKIRTETAGGASPYLTLGAALIREEDSMQLTTKLGEICSKVGKKSLHCSALKHPQKVFYSREISKEPVLFFGLVSFKETLGSYAEEIEENGTKYFNKCAQYLLEIVGAHMGAAGIQQDKMRVVFEEGHHDYARFRKFFKKCQDNPIYKQTEALKNIDLRLIVDAPKESTPLLQLGDLAAHALFKAVDKTQSNYLIPEPRYLNELHKSFHADPSTRKVVGYGIKAIHSLNDIRLDDDIKQMFSNFKSS